jgi:hypothetical protein
LLHRVGVHVVVGSDHAETSLAEVMQLRHLSSLRQPARCSRCGVRTTPAAIFPGSSDRKDSTKGTKPVLSRWPAIPLEDFSQVQRIRAAIQAGGVSGRLSRLRTLLRQQRCTRVTETGRLQPASRRNLNVRSGHEKERGNEGRGVGALFAVGCLATMVLLGGIDQSIARAAEEPSGQEAPVDRRLIRWR